MKQENKNDSKFNWKDQNVIQYIGCYTRDFPFMQCLDKFV